jgi:hypothetical protein
MSAVSADITLRLLPPHPIGASGWSSAIDAAISLLERLRRAPRERTNARIGRLTGRRDK